MSRSSPPAPTACPTSSLRRMRSSPTRRRRAPIARPGALRDRKSTRLNSSHSQISYAVFCLKKKKNAHLANPELTIVHDLHPRLAHAWRFHRRLGSFRVSLHSSPARPPRAATHILPLRHIV